MIWQLFFLDLSQSENFLRLNHLYYVLMYRSLPANDYYAKDFIISVVFIFLLGIFNEIVIIFLPVF